VTDEARQKVGQAIADASLMLSRYKRLSETLANIKPHDKELKRDVAAVKELIARLDEAAMILYGV